MLMMLSTGISAQDDGYTMDNMYVIDDGMLWIPVETTLIGKPFTQAWEAGSKAYYQWQDNGLGLLNVHAAWGTYKPASLPQSVWQPDSVARSAIEQRFPDQHATLLRMDTRTRMRRYLQAIEQNPQDLDAHLQAGIISAKAGDVEEAKKFFATVLAAEPGNAVALNNRGNLQFMAGKYQGAITDYQAAAKADPQDALIWINQARTYRALKDTEQARAAFLKAQAIDPEIRKQYRTMAVELLGH